MINKEWIIKNQRTLTFWICFLIVTLSLTAIGFVVYVNFFYTPPIYVDPYYFNISEVDFGK